VPDCDGYSDNVHVRGAVAGTDVTPLDPPVVLGVAGLLGVPVPTGAALGVLGAASDSALPPHAAVINAALVVRKVLRFIR